MGRKSFIMEILEALQTSLGFDWRVTVANIINFAIVYFVLKKLVFDKIGVVLSERRAKIEGGLDQAKEADELHKKASLEREEILRKARFEATDIVSSAREKEAKVISESTGKAAKEADKIIAEAKEKAASEHEAMLESFKSEASSLVVLAAEKLLQDDIVSAEKHSVAARYLQNSQVGK